MSVERIIPLLGSTVGVDRFLEHRFEESFNVIVSRGTRPVEVLRHPNIPKPYQPHPDFAAAFVEDVFLKQINNRLYQLDVPYTNFKLPGEKQYEQQENPLNRAAEIDVKSTTVRELIERDWEGNALVNTAGDLLVGVEEDEALWDISIVKNVRPSIPAWFEDYANALNKDTVRIKGRTAKKKQLRVSGIHIPVSGEENGTEFIRLSLNMVYRKKGWERKFLNFGLREKYRYRRGDEIIETLVPIKDHRGKAIDQAVPLDKNGRAFRRLIQFRDGTRRAFLRDATKSEIENNILTYDTRPVLSFRRLPLS